MTTTAYPDHRTRRGSFAMVAARALAGLLGLTQLTAAVFFTFVAPEESVWIGPWVDVPVVALLITGALLKVTVSAAPGVHPHRRVALGLGAVALGVAVSLVKIPLYDEPEGLIFVAFDAVLLALLLTARRGIRR